MQNKNLRSMAAIALLMAMVVVMQFLSGIIPPVGGFSISLVLIPIVLGAAAFGIQAGAILGATFGAIVYINCVTGADPGGQMVFQASPILCFVVVMGKGVLAGVLSGAVYHWLKDRNKKVAILCAAAICPVANTGFFLLCMLTFFREVLSVWAGGGSLVVYVLSGLVLMNFVPELIINVIFSPAAGRIVDYSQKKL